MSESTLPPIDTPSSSKRKRLDLTDNSSNFVYYASYNRSMTMPIFLKPCNVLDASSY